MLRRVGLQRGLLRRHNRLKLASWPSDLLAEALSAQPLRLALRPASAAAAAPLQRRDCEVGLCAGLQTRGFAGGSPPSPSSPSSPSRGKTTDLASYAAKGRKVTQRPKPLAGRQLTDEEKEKQRKRREQWHGVEMDKEADAVSFVE
ncbi:unnamed protein product [Polarella glacialis]|uniref:Uncharacterized protein n=1 Tax=Polarella glacialis TaxID=89957 RepID=A0A813HPS4_POLGL|nr:unnamed protein product [Polarella glacialis]